MDTLDNETIEQIKSIVNDAKNNNTPLQKAKRPKKIKVVERTSCRKRTKKTCRHLHRNQ